MTTTDFFRQLLIDDDMLTAMRELLIDPDATSDDLAAIADDLRPADLDRMRDAIRYMITDSTQRESLTELLLESSLCPLHRIDYAICFDDDDPECAAIRTIHPSHDS